jgi:hypothetical protein
MEGPLKPFQSTSGMNTSGVASGSRTETRNLLSSVMCRVWSQWRHIVSISTERISFLNCPCTKGAAMASSAQAAYRRSPLLNFSLCGVDSTVTG